mgnify:CR=1 FL=1
MRRVVEVAYAATAIRLPDITMVQAICGYYDVVLVLVVVVGVPMVAGKPVHV